MERLSWIAATINNKMCPEGTRSRSRIIKPVPSISQTPVGLFVPHHRQVASLS